MVGVKRKSCYVISRRDGTRTASDFAGWVFEEFWPWNLWSPECSARDWGREEVNIKQCDIEFTENSDAIFVTEKRDKH